MGRPLQQIQLRLFRFRVAWRSSLFRFARLRQGAHPFRGHQIASPTITTTFNGFLHAIRICHNGLMPYVFLIDFAIKEAS